MGNVEFDLYSCIEEVTEEVIVLSSPKDMFD
jgi:hypothetical protein